MLDVLISLLIVLAIQFTFSVVYLSRHHDWLIYIYTYAGLWSLWTHLLFSSSPCALALDGGGWDPSPPVADGIWTQVIVCHHSNDFACVCTCKRWRGMAAPTQTPDCRWVGNLEYCVPPPNDVANLTSWHQHAPCSLPPLEWLQPAKELVKS